MNLRDNLFGLLGLLFVLGGGFPLVAGLSIEDRPELKEYNLLRGAHGQSSFLVLKSNSDLVMLDEDGDIIPLPIPEKGMPQSWYLTGDWIVGNWRDRNVTTVRVLNLREREAWVDVPKLEANMYISWGIPDAKGKPVVTDYRGEAFRYVDPETGKWESYFVPVMGATRQFKPQTLYVGETTWVVNRRYRDRSGNGDFGGLLRILDGVPELLKIYDGTKEQVTGLVPVGEGQMMIQFWSGKRRFVDTRNAGPVNTPRFDASAMGDQLVFCHAEAPDGAIWMLTFARPGSEESLRELASGRFHDVWRWDGESLERVAQGIERQKIFGFSYYGTYSPPSMHALSRDELWVGTQSAGLLWVKDGEPRRLDWRMDFPASSVGGVMASATSVAFVDGSTLREISQDELTSLDLPKELDDRFISLGEFYKDQQGDFHALSFQEEGAVVSSWDGKEWRGERMLPVAHTNLWSFGFDSLNRPWAYEGGVTNPVYVWQGPADEDWLEYENRQQAYEKEVALHGTDFKPGIARRQIYWRPLVVPDGQIWFMDVEGAVNVFQDGTWETFGGKNLQPGNDPRRFSGPVCNHEGVPVVSTGQDWMTRRDGKWVFVDAPRNLRTLAMNQGRSAQFRGNTNDPRYKSHGGIMVGTRDPFGFEWFVNNQNELVCLRRGKATHYSLKGSSAYGEQVLSLVSDQQGRFFIGGGDRYSLRYWTLFDPKVPRMEFDVIAESRDNEIEVAVFNQNGELASTTIMTRLDEGEWLPQTRYVGVREGEHRIGVRCYLKPPKPFFSETKSVAIEVPGNLLVECQKQVAALGALEYKTRKAAFDYLLAAGEYAVPLLRTAETDDDPEVSVAARRLLREIGK